MSRRPLSQGERTPSGSGSNGASAAAGAAAGVGARRLLPAMARTAPAGLYYLTPRQEVLARSRQSRNGTPRHGQPRQAPAGRGEWLSGRTARCPPARMQVLAQLSHDVKLEVLLPWDRGPPTHGTALPGDAFGSPLVLHSGRGPVASSAPASPQRPGKALSEDPASPEAATHAAYSAVAAEVALSAAAAAVATAAVKGEVAAPELAPAPAHLSQPSSQPRPTSQPLPQRHAQQADPSTWGFAGNGESVGAAADAGTSSALLALPRDDLQPRPVSAPSSSEVAPIAPMPEHRKVSRMDVREEDLEAEAEREALEQTLMPHYVLIGAEKMALEAALIVARKEAREQSVVFYIEGKDRSRSTIPDTKCHEKALESFVCRTIRRSIGSELVHIDQWKVLLESPLKSWYDPVLTRFPAAMVHAGISGFTKLTESLARQEQAAERIATTLNGFFRPLLDLVDKHGGDIVKFTGDALTIIWPARDVSDSYIPAADEAEEPEMRPIFRRPSDQRRASRESVDYDGEEPELPDGLSDNSKSDDGFGSEEDQDEMFWSCTQTEGGTSLLTTVALNAAAAFCLDVQQEIFHFGHTPVPGCVLELHMAVGYSEVSLLQLGGLFGRWEYCVAGDVLKQVAAARSLASSEDVIFSPAAASLGQQDLRFEVVEKNADGSALNQKQNGCAKLMGFKGNLQKTKQSKSAQAYASQDSRASRGSVTFAPDTRMESKGLSDDGKSASLPWWNELSGVGKSKDRKLDLRLVKRFVPSAVALKLAGSSEAEVRTMTYPEEMRQITVIFLSISGLRPDDNNTMHQGLSGGRETQLLMRLIQRSVYALEGCINKFVVDDSGIFILIIFGLPPLIHFMDDPTRAVLCAMRICDTLKDEGLNGRVGIATGKCWCGVVGSRQRREYVVIGDTVNLAARLMGRAPVNKVVVDSRTYEMAMQVGEFEEHGSLQVPGKSSAVPYFRFLRTRKAMSRHRKELNASLISWADWPGRLNLLRALEANTYKSGVVIIHGPGGAGKTELTEGVRAWAQDRGWTWLYGQNIDPSGTFALPRLALQEAYRELVSLASQDPYWRSHGWELLMDSIGGRLTKDLHKSKIDHATLGQQARRGPPAHAELFWMLVAMIRDSVGEEEAASIEPWAPLLSLVVTQLAFGPRMVDAMIERDEQHARNNRFAELCTAVLDAFSRHGSASGGTVFMLHLKKCSAFSQIYDSQQASVVHALAELCVKRRRNAPPEGEPRPLLLCIVSRNVADDDRLLNDAARECDGVVTVEDLALPETSSFLDHLMKPRLSDPRHRAHLPGTPIVRPIAQGWNNTRTPATGTEEEQEEAADIARRHEALATYVSDMSGGSPYAVLGLFHELKRCKVLIPGNDGVLIVDPQFRDAAKIRKVASVPENLASIAFSIFERFDLVEQTLLKAVSIFEREVGMRDFVAAMPKMQQEVLEGHIRHLASKKVRGLRRVIVDSESSAEQKGTRKRVSLRQSLTDQKEYFRFYSGLLLHAASSLLLESQKAQVRRNTQVLNMQDLSSILAQDRSECDGIDEEDSNSEMSSAKNSARNTPTPPPRSGTPTASQRGSVRKSVRLSQVEETDS